METLDTQFKGFISDTTRDQIPRGHCFRMADWLPNYGAPARKRGGWEYSSKLLTYDVNQLGWFRKTTGTTEHLIAVLRNGSIVRDTTFDGTGGTVVGTMGEAGPFTQKPFYFLGKLIIPKRTGGFRTWDGSTVAAGASSYKVGASWGDFVVYGNTTADATALAWGITASSVVSGSTWAMPSEIVAIAGFPRQVVVWGYSDCWTLLGDQPPPGGNLTQRTLFAGNGIMDQRSLTLGTGYAIWANSTGVWQTDGTTPLNLTDRGGISRFWQAAVKDFDLSEGWACASGLFGEWLVVSVTDQDGALVTTIACHLSSYDWIELQNVDASSMARRTGGSAYTEELFFGRTSENRVGKLASIFTPDTALSEDGDGTEVLPYLETPFYRVAGFDTARLQNLFTTYDLRASSGSPTLRAGFVTSPEDTDYHYPSRELPVVTSEKRHPTDVRRAARGVGFRVELTSQADDARIYGLEIEASARFEKR